MTKLASFSQSARISNRTIRLLLPALALGLCANHRLFGQESTQATSPAAPDTTLVASSTGNPPADGVSSSLAGTPAVSDAPLPEAPLPQTQQNQTSTVHGTSGPHIAPLHSEYVPAGWTAPALTAHDKVVAGLKDSVSLDNFGGMLVSASYEYVVNSAPNYSPGDAYGKRIGAAAIRETSETLFYESVFAPLLHEDSRYYQKGDGHGFIPRTLYAITRPLITRTDHGTETVNASLLLGYAGSSALTYAYYPPINQNFRNTASTFGGAIGGAALGFFVEEFSDDVLEALHLKHHLD